MQETHPMPWSTLTSCNICEIHFSRTQSCFRKQCIDLIHTRPILINGPITICSHKCTSDSECFDATKQQFLSAFVRTRRDGCVLYNDYHQNKKKTYLIDPIFHFRHWLMILWWQSTEPRDCAWSDCCRHWPTPYDDCGIPTCDSNDVTHSAVELSQASSNSLETHGKTCIKTKRTPFFEHHLSTDKLPRC